jgi:uncharacterized protein (TIGR02246 family)
VTDTPDIESLRAQWVEAFNAHDLDRHVALYTGDALLFGSNDTLHQGHHGIRAYFGALPVNAAVRSYPAPVVRQLSDDVAVTAAHVEFGDGETRLPYRLTWTVVRRGGNWRIAQHHGSPCKA